MHFSCPLCLYYAIWKGPFRKGLDLASFPSPLVLWVRPKSCLTGSQSLFYFVPQLQSIWPDYSPPPLWAMPRRLGVFILESFPKGRHDCKPLSPFWFPQTVDGEEVCLSCKTWQPMESVGTFIITSTLLHILCLLVKAHIFFSCPGQLNRRPCHSLREWVSESETFDFSVFRALWLQGLQWLQWLQWLHRLQWLQ